ncbi:MAG TPA: hypothetical protein VEY92_01190 [Pseudoxanthomonas sp.]|nr:hypothetical protein [Pseudoxanthomonas sp.]
MRRLAHCLFNLLMFYVASERPPNFQVGAHDAAGAYLRRWYLVPRNRLFNVYLHHFLRDDDDRALHDHPWAWASLLLRGSYIEHTINAGGVHRRRTRHAGRWKFSLPSRAHRIELLPMWRMCGTFEDAQKRFDRDPDLKAPCWTLFITGPRVHEWGFHCPQRGWVHFTRFTRPGAYGERGPGCDG